jgi:hypothetical protein
LLSIEGRYVGTIENCLGLDEEELLDGFVEEGEVTDDEEMLLWVAPSTTGFPTKKPVASRNIKRTHSNLKILNKFASPIFDVRVCTV